MSASVNIHKILESSPRPIALDLYCGGGGAGYGLTLSGFKTVIGIDKENRKASYEAASPAMKFVQADVTALEPSIIARFDFVWASPPCQAFCTIIPKKMRELHEDKWKAQNRHINLIPRTRELLAKANVPYIIENVQSAAKELRGPVVMLCGTMFDLGVFRHRMFESGQFALPTPPKCSHRDASLGEIGRAMHGVGPLIIREYELLETGEKFRVDIAGAPIPLFTPKEVHYPSRAKGKKHEGGRDFIYLPQTDEMCNALRKAYKRRFARSIKEAVEMLKLKSKIIVHERTEERARGGGGPNSAPSQASDADEEAPTKKQMYPIYGISFKRGSTEEWQQALGGVTWMTREEMAQCIPPAYSKYCADAYFQAVANRRIGIGADPGIVEGLGTCAPCS